MAGGKDNRNDKATEPGSVATDATSPATLSSTSYGAPPDAAAPAAPAQRIGRYEVVRTLGEGGMGVVYEAIDPELDRRVAVKVLRAARTGDGTYGERMRREAQALAKLSHAHVVAVYDAGTSGDETFIVMQLIDGVTLEHHLEATQPTAEQAVALYVQAARGLAAAHAAGIVHRDFKPSNALVDAAGLVRVSDFGLATAALVVGDPAAEAGVTSSGNLRMTLTKDGLLGTPAYMAPEQFEGEKTSPATDQFALCVALWHALYGERPFAGTTLIALSLNVTSGNRRPPPAKARVPARVYAALDRGLAVDPAKRFPSMTALADALSPPRSRRRAWVVVGATVAALAAGAIAMVALARDDDGARTVPVDPCIAVAHEIDALWTPARATAIEAHLAPTTEVTGLVERRLAAWRAMRGEVCRAIPSPTVSRRAHCLALARASLAQTLDQLPTAARAKASGLVGGSLDPARCTATDSGAIASSAVDHDAAYAEIEGLRLAWMAGYPARVVAARDAMTARLAPLHDPSLDAHWDLQLGFALGMSGDSAGSRAAFRACAESALSAGLDERAARCWGLLATATAEASELKVADEMLAMARGVAARAPSPGLQAELDENAAQIEIDRGDFPTAARLALSALATMRARREPMDIIEAYDTLIDAYSNAHDFAGLYATALPALVLSNATYGPDDITTIRIARAIAVARTGLEDPGAKVAWDALIAQGTRVYGPDDVELMRLLMDRATAESAQGTSAPPQTVAAIKRAVEIGEAKLPAKDPERAQLYEILAYVQVAIHDFDGAHATYRRLVSLLETVDDPMAMSRVLMNYADTLKETGKCAEAIPLFKRVVKVSERTGMKALFQGVGIGSIGTCEIRAGNYAAGIPDLQHAMAILDEAGNMVAEAAPIRFELAKARWRTGDKAGGIAYAKASLDLLASFPSIADEERAAITAWIAKPE